MTPNHLAAEIIRPEKLRRQQSHVSRQWRFFARAVLIFAGVYAVAIAIVLSVLAVWGN